MKSFWLNLLVAALAGLGGVWFGGIFIPLIWEGQVAKADVLASLGTWAGSIGTIGTLFFLIRQNLDLRKSQKEADKKQQKMWDTQREIIAFQKLQTHKQQFNEMLDELERNYPVSFIDRSSLYKNIFPNNNFECCSTRVSLTKDTNAVRAGGLSDIRDAANYLSESLDSFSHTNSSYRHTHDHLGLLSSALLLLHVVITHPKETGTISVDIGDGYSILNVFDPSFTLRVIEKIVNSLMEFTGNDENYTAILSHKRTSYYLDSLWKFAFLELNHRGYSVLKEDGHAKHIDILVRSQQLASQKEARRNRSVNSIYIELTRIFTEKTELKALLNSCENLRELYREILYGVAEHCDNGECSGEFHRLRDDLRTLIRSLRQDTLRKNIGSEVESA